MGEFTKGQDDKFTKDEKGEKGAFEQLDKDQQSQQDLTGEQKGQDPAQVKQEEQTGGQQQFQKPGQRQQGDEDLDEDSKSRIDSQGMK
jgi:hypothetical protein